MADSGADTPTPLNYRTCASIKALAGIVPPGLCKPCGAGCKGPNPNAKTVVSGSTKAGGVKTGSNQDAGFDTQPVTPSSSVRVNGNTGRASITKGGPASGVKGECGGISSKSVLPSTGEGILPGSFAGSLSGFGSLIRGGKDSDAKKGGPAGEPKMCSNPDSILYSMREPLAEYQEKRGLPKTESYSFMSLMTTLYNATYNAVITICTMLMNLIPLLEGFLYVCRFMLDKLIDINETQEPPKKALKIVLFVSELLVIGIALMIICGFVLIPVLVFTMALFGKFWASLFGPIDSGAATAQ